MKALRTLLDKVGQQFEKGGRLHNFHAIYEATDTILFTPGQVTRTA